VTPGTLISANELKGDKTYYAGDLILSTPSITVSQSAFNASVPLTITSPDGANIGFPGDPWNDHSGYFFVSMLTTSALGTFTFPPAPSWTMSFQAYLKPPVGTYQFHIVSGRDGADSSVGWEYDAFLTVNVVE
jgi:hypothetical protein